jgi:ATP-binding cassette subfamily C (CFTR/MRP) protein 1
VVTISHESGCCWLDGDGNRSCGGYEEKTSAGAIGVAFLNLTTLGETMTNLITFWRSMETSMGAIARIEAFVRDTPTETNVESPVEVSPQWPAHGVIAVENLYAKYDDDKLTGEKAGWFLNDINFDIRAGETVAICGRSGSGKSTMFLSLLALLEDKKGSILVDGVDISRVKHSLLRSRFHVISQDTFLQGDTVPEALGPDGSFSNEAISEVLLECGLSQKLTASGGLSAKMSDVEFSVGEAQLFALARTILMAGSTSGGIVLFDQATSR